MERMTFFSIFTSCESFFARSGPKAPTWTDLRKVWPGRCQHWVFFDPTSAADAPMLAFPNRRPPLVDDDGGGGFWICDAVGARDWRIEYVLCMLG